MSTLKVTALKNPSSSANNIVLNTNGTVGSITSSGTVSGATVTSSGNVNDSVSDVRTPRFTVHTGGDLTVSDEGVLRIGSSATLTTLTLGSVVGGTIICVYNNKSSSITLACGTTVTSMRIGADNNSTHNATLTLGAKSLTTITLVASNVAVVTGTDVT